MSLHVVIGGTRSGKSSRGEALASATGLPVTYVATGAAVDDEMRARIAVHRARRPASWTTAEPADGEPLDAARRVARAGACALVDGLGGWIATAQHHDGDGCRARILAATHALAADAAEAPGIVIVVAEEAGGGVTPADALSRAWVDLLGEVTQVLAAAAAGAELVVAGRAIPLPPSAGPVPALPGSTAPTPAPADLGALRIHGDRAVRPGDADHAVSVLQGGPPPWLLDTLRTALDEDVDRYPDERPACAALAALHGRADTEVVPTNGAAEALWLLAPALRPRLAAVVHPGFTETEAGLHAHDVPVVRVLRDPDRAFALDPAAVPEAADLVVLGNPVSPSGTLDPRAAILALRRPGRTVVVDEAFMDLVPGEPGSLAGSRLPDVVVVRSLTKSLGLPGLRAGYALCPSPIADRLRAARPPWSVNALALAALRAVALRPASLHEAAGRAARERSDLVARVGALDRVRLWPSHTNFVLVEVPDGPAVVTALRARNVAVRHATTFPGLGDDHLRLTARDPAANTRLAAALDAVTAP